MTKYSELGVGPELNTKYELSILAESSSNGIKSTGKKKTHIEEYSVRYSSYRTPLPIRNWVIDPSTTTPYFI